MARQKAGTARCVLQMLLHAWLCFGVGALLAGCSAPGSGSTTTDHPVQSHAAEPALEAATDHATAAHSEIGFRTPHLLREHFGKHGREFGSISIGEYLARAQRLRDAAAGGAVLEHLRDDGVISRFDRETGAFIAFDSDLTIRTFFRPRDGERYFERQASRRRH